MTNGTVGGFEIVREIGRGGMGTVYEAWQKNPMRRVALKVLPPDIARSPGVAARFGQEANRMAQLDEHPNIATVHLAGEDNGIAYFAMQLLTGGDLEQRLARQGRFDQREAAEIIAKVADALEHAHRQGIVHRDIKPANIMFDAQNEPVVTDFGIATAADEMRMTQTGISVCTPEYASPEQLKGNPVDGRSDIYSLGLVLYQMVCGTHPFRANTPMAVAMKQLSENAPPPKSFRPDISPALEQIIWSCLSRDPSERYSTARQLATSLRAFATGRGQPAVTVVSPHPAVQPTRTAPPTGMVFAITLAAFLGIGLVLGAGILLGQRTPIKASPVQHEVSVPGNPADREYSPPPPPPPVSPGPVSAPPVPTPAENDVQTIETLQEKWRSSWEDQDLNTHISCFWHDAYVDGMYLPRYEQYQAGEFNRQPEMHVTVRDLVVTVNGDKATTKFTQHFHGRGPASDYESEGRVTQSWQARDGEWRIVRVIYVKTWSRKG